MEYMILVKSNHDSIMETITSMKDNSTKTKTDLVSMSIKRNNSTGVTLKVKSQKFADFFKDNETRSYDRTVKVNGLSVEEVIRIGGVSRTSEQYYQFTNDTTALRTSDGLANLSFLQETRIGEGVEFEIYGRYSIDALNDFKKQFKESVTKFYIENMQKVKIDLEIGVLE